MYQHSVRVDAYGLPGEEIHRRPCPHVLELKMLVAVWAADLVPHSVLELASDGLRQAVEARAESVIAC